ncbi:hypothetical protein LCY76_23685 [Fictibacillus sp. KIGAM418]|uniref:Uncharacterized protein n=1 Tax=Fictibacillus marinisediminis TaxID=2878389 RepID=A0A9X1XL70_9BACL|nr:hypothetical protein [Fictibacillus marinisediminis]MCK6259574.1 hypothetical protein [Fictibacillus marinisediminis]
MKGFNDRCFQFGDQVDVYRNLNSGGSSIRCSKTKLFVAHVESVELKESEFRVSEPGWQKVILQKRKSVHAYIKGNLVSINLPKPESYVRQVHYNPYITLFFM